LKTRKKYKIYKVTKSWETLRNVLLFKINYLKNILKILAPIFRSMPLLVVGMPVFLANRCLACVMPNNLFNENENPNLPMT